jgi:hypothetical protein
MCLNAQALLHALGLVAADVSRQVKIKRYQAYRDEEEDAGQELSENGTAESHGEARAFTPFAATRAC